MTAIVLGAAAGGGFPQWNCRCPVCRLAWAGDARVRPRLQASLAVSADRERWTLLNASPDLGAQLRATPTLHPRQAIRGSPISAVVLTGAEIDETAGLLSLRESTPFALYAAAETLAILAANSMFGVLQESLVRRIVVAPNEVVQLPGGIEAEMFSVPGKVPLYLEAQHPDLLAAPMGNIGIDLRSNGARLIYVPGAAAVPDQLQERVAAADVLLFDGTLFADDEMIHSGVGAKTGRRMGHLPIDGPDGSLARLAGFAKRRIFTHINNTNPILIEGSPERRRVEAAGFEVAADGLEIVL
ncbi:MAG: pyrroloquinoline quinone biosynthesis protein PqqB [Xanthobacteraceae bacterium]